VSPALSSEVFPIIRVIRNAAGVSEAFGVVRRFGLGGEHDGDRPGAPVGPPLSGSA
jgi:hypothetical protein